MADTLVELVAKIKTDPTGLEKGLTDAERKTEASSKKMAESLKKVGVAMAASGAAITAALGLMGKAAINEQINVKRLSSTLASLGINYDDIKGSLEAVIAATQRKTGIADTEQRDILGRLILVTKDYDKALSLLPTTLDLMAEGQMSGVAAATYLAKAYEDLEAGAESVGIRFGQSTLQFKSMEDIQGRLRNKAEDLANPFNVLVATMSDLSEEIGENLIPIIKETIADIVNTTEKITAWIKENPELARTITLVTGALAGFLLTVGTGILVIPKLKAALVALKGAMVAFLAIMSAHPIIAIITAIGLLIGVGFALWANWDKLTGKAKDLTKTVKEQFDNQARIIQASYDRQREAARKTYDDAIDFINKEYGLVKDVSKSKREIAEGETAKLKEEYQRQKDAARDRYDFEITEIRDAASEKLASLDVETDASIKALQNQINAIEKQTEQEETAFTRAEEAKRLGELKTAHESAKTAEDKARTKEKWDEYAADVARRESRRARDEEKDSLRDRIDAVRDAASKRKEQIKLEEDAELAKLKLTYDAEIEQYTKLTEIANKELAEALERIELERKALISAEETKLKASLETIQKTEQAEIEALKEQLIRTNEQIKNINLAYDALQKRYDIEIVTHHIDEYSSSGEGGVTTPSTPITTPVTTPSTPSGKEKNYQYGGIVGETGMAYLHAGETIIPANESMGGITINFTQPVFFDREDTMNKFVDMIRKGIQRQDRLRFGGAYSG